jgi:hypothetical protein
LQDEDIEPLRRSWKLRELLTVDAVGFLAPSICTILSTSLTKLTLEGNRKMVRFEKEQEGALQLLTSLQDLQFECFYKLQCLPTCLHKLHKLKRLQIGYCNRIPLPEDGLSSVTIPESS